MPMEKNHSKNNKKWILKNPLKHKAHMILNDALKSKPYKKPLFYEKAKKLRDEGLSYKEISKKIGISKSQIYKWLNKVNYN